MTIVPVVLGAGKPLFDRRLPGGAMQLTGVFPRANGMVELRRNAVRCCDLAPGQDMSVAREDT